MKSISRIVHTVRFAIKQKRTWNHLKEKPQNSLEIMTMVKKKKYKTLQNYKNLKNFFFSIGALFRPSLLEL